MLIQKVKISNYKTYLSLDLDLSVDDERPIILIGGGNGGGKTTLFEAISGALYGLKIDNAEHFNELLNQGALDSVPPIIELQITFVGKVLGQTQKFRESPRLPEVSTAQACFRAATARMESGPSTSRAGAKRIQRAVRPKRSAYIRAGCQRRRARQNLQIPIVCRRRIPSSQSGSATECRPQQENTNCIGTHRRHCEALRHLCRRLAQLYGKHRNQCIPP